MALPNKEKTGKQHGAQLNTHFKDSTLGWKHTSHLEKNKPHITHFIQVTLKYQFSTVASEAIPHTLHIMSQEALQECSFPYFLLL